MVAALGRLDYCDAVLACLPELKIGPLQRVQKAAARLITNTKSRDHITPVLMRLHWWLPIKSRIFYKLSPDAPYSHQPAAWLHGWYMVRLTATSSSRPGLVSASRLLYRKRALKTKFGKRAFSHAAGPAAWNSLPGYIQLELNTKNFKKILETYIKTLHCHFTVFNFLSFYCIVKCPPVYCVGGQ